MRGVVRGALVRGAWVHGSQHTGTSGSVRGASGAWPAWVRPKSEQAHATFPSMGLGRRRCAGTYRRSCKVTGGSVAHWLAHWLTASDWAWMQVPCALSPRVGRRAGACGKCRTAGGQAGRRATAEEAQLHLHYIVSSTLQRPGQGRQGALGTLGLATAGPKLRKGAGTGERSPPAQLTAMPPNRQTAQEARLGSMSSGAQVPWPDAAAKSGRNTRTGLAARSSPRPIISWCLGPNQTFSIRGTGVVMGGVMGGWERMVMGWDGWLRGCVVVRC